MSEQVNPANQTTPASTTPQAKKPLNWKLIGIISIVAAILLGGGAYAAVVLDIFNQKEEPKQTSTTTTKTATPSTTTKKEEPKDETTDWKTYTGKEYTFKYPSDWKVETTTLQIGELRLTSPDLVTDPLNETEPLINVKAGTMIRFLPSKEYPTGKDLKEYLNENGFSSYFDKETGVLTETTLAGEKSVRIDTKLGVYSASKDYITTSYYVVNNGKFYQIPRLYPEGKQSEYENIFKKVLSTFKFL